MTQEPGHRLTVVSGFAILEAQQQPGRREMFEWYQTMTVQGSTGNRYQAEHGEAAAKMAEADGYEVLDIMDDILVIAD